MFSGVEPVGGVAVGHEIRRVTFASHARTHSPSGSTPSNVRTFHSQSSGCDCW